MTDRAVRADDVIRAFYRAFAVSVGGRVVERDGVVACIGVHPSPFVTNTAWRADPATDPATVLRVIDDAYVEAGFVGGLLTSSRTDSDLEAAAAAGGRHLVTELPVMTVDRATFVPPPTTATRRVDPLDDLEALRTVLIEGFFEDDPSGRPLVEATFAHPASIAGPGIRMFLAELAGLPAAAAGAWMVGADATIGWVATVPWARRRGLGAAVTARAVGQAFDDGAQFAVLQASPSGRPVYERLGFTAVGLDRIWEPNAG